MVLSTLWGVVTFYAPAKFALIALVVLLISDTYLGVKAARKNRIPITSNRFNNLFAKSLSYLIWVGFGIIINLEFGLNYAVWIMAAFPLFSEIKSIDEKQRALGQEGIFKKIDDLFKFAKNIKEKQDDLRK